MSYTTKQRIYAEYMLKQIGITDSDFIEKYLVYLIKIYGKMEVAYTRYNDNGYGWDVWKFTVRDCISSLKFRTLV